MARREYGASPADYFIDSSGAPVPGAIANVFDQETGGTQQTDLLDAGGVTATVVTADSFGGFRFFGPNNYAGALWIQAPGGSQRYRVDPVDMAPRLSAVESSVVTNTAAISTEVSARSVGDQQTLSDATAQSAQDAADAVLNHVAVSDPHPNYLTVLDASTGAVKPNVRLWVGSVFPGAALGVQDEDLLVYEG